MAKKEAPPPTFHPPASPEAEQSVLGAILVRPDVLDELCDKLVPEDFYREAHGRIYMVMLGLYNQEIPVDLVTVTAKLDDVGWLDGVGGAVFLAGLSEQVGFATNALYYAEIVRDKARLRRLLDTTQEIAAGCLAPVENVAEYLDAAEEKIFQIKDQDSHAQAVYTEAEVVPAEIQRLEQIYERKKEVLGVPSGLIDLDAITGGWQNGDLILLAGRPSMGKTALALNNILYYPATQGTPGVFFSMEQPKEQLVQRQLASVGSINSYWMRSNRMDGEDWSRLHAAAGELMGLPIFFIDRAALATLEIRAITRRLRSRQKIELVVIDYLQLAKAKGSQSREQEVARVSGSLKALAKELFMPVIALAQLSRKVEERNNKRPMLADLRESGSLEQDADVVIFLYRDEVYYPETSKYKGIAECHVAKHRNGPTGRIKLTYLPEYMRFGNHSPEME